MSPLNHRPTRMLALLVASLATIAASLVAIGSGPAGAAPAGSGPRLQSVSCVSTTFCMAGDEHGQVLLYNGRTWTTSAQFATKSIVVSVSCASTQFCMAAYEPDTATGFHLLTYNGHSWTKSPAYAGNYFGNGDCPSAKLCFVFDEAGYIHGWTGTRWALLKTRFDDNVVATACSSPRHCFALGQSGDIFRYDGKSWTKSHHHLSGGHDHWKSFSCAGTDTCTAISSSGQLARNVRGTWTRTKTARNSWEFRADELTGDCAVAALCVAVDLNGNTARYQDDAWDAYNPLPGTNQNKSFTGADAISCASKSFCLAVGYRGSYWTFTEGHWNARSAV